MPSIQEMQADLHTAQAHGDTALAQHIQGLIQQAQRQQHGAINGLPDYGDVGNRLATGAMEAGHQLFGLGDLGGAAGHWANQYFSGHPISWDQARSDYQQALHSAEQTNPVSATLGGVAGAVDGSVMLGGAASAATKALPAARAAQAALTLQRGQRAANAARLVVGGAAAGAAQGAATGAGQAAAANQDVGAGVAQGAELGGATGAVLGPAVGMAVPAIAKATAPLASKTAQALAKVFGEDPADLQATWQTFQSNTGRAPTMAELATLKQRGEIANAAKDSSQITATLSQAADDAARARSASMQDAVSQVQPPSQVGPPAAQSSGEVQNAATARGDADYGAARQFDFQIPTEESEALGGVSPSDHLASEVVPLAGLGRADRVRIMSDLQNGRLSGQDAQLIRSNLGRAQGTGANYSPAIASAQADFEHILGSPGNEDAQAALQHANTNYVANAQRGAGAAHGESMLGAQTADNFAAEAASKTNANPNFQAGMASGARSKLADQAATPRGATSLARSFADDDSLHAKLATTFGPEAADALRRLGQSETGAADNLQPFAKRTPQPDDQDSKDLNTGLRALAAAASHGVYQFYHGAKAIAGLGMSPAVQEKVAQYLADPKMTAQGINLLRKAGATNAQLRDLALQAAQHASATGANLVTSAAEQ